LKLVDNTRLVVFPIPLNSRHFQIFACLGKEIKKGKQQTSNSSSLSAKAFIVAEFVIVGKHFNK
jgi:hypothetical protein